MTEPVSDFDIIACGYNIADETINFGTRNLAEGDNLYEVATLATLRSSDTRKGLPAPHLNTTLRNGIVYFTVNSSIKSFKNKECSDLALNATFDATIDLFTIKGDFLLVCLRNGIVHMLNCKNDHRVECSLLVLESVEEVDLSHQLFVDLFEDGPNFLLVTRDGLLIRLAHDGDDLKMETVHDFKFTVSVASFCPPLLLVSGSTLVILDTETGLTTEADLDLRFKTILPLNHMFLGLDLEGCLFRICAITLAVFPVENCTLFEDVLLVRDLRGKVHLVAVTKQPARIQLLSYPDLAPVYSLKVSGDVHVIEPESADDDVLYVSKTADGEGAIRELRFHTVYETVPEKRLRRLLRRRKYKEAERFAGLFHLDMDLVTKARAQDIIDKTLCDSGDVDNFLALLDSLANDRDDNDEFKLQACLNMEGSCEHLGDVRRVLRYGCDLHLTGMRNKAAEEQQRFLMNLMFKFDTYTTIHRDGGVQEWTHFLECDLVEQLKTFLRGCMIEEAMIVYSRLDEFTMKNLTETQVVEILDILNNIPMSTYWPFLPIFIPTTLSILPSTLPCFVRWTYGKVFYLEKQNKTDFPHNAITFTEHILEMIKVEENATTIAFKTECTLNGDSSSKLSHLLIALKGLKVLREDHGITIPVNEYLAGPENVVKILLNVAKCTENLDALLQRFLFKFILENGLNPNEIFVSQIIDLVKYEQRYWVNIVTPILNCITSVSVKVQAVLAILDSASVPWCETVRRIARTALEYSHPLVSRVRELVENEPVQVVLRRFKYKIKERRITDIDVLKFVVQRIIYCNEETMVEDVYQLCKSEEERHVASSLLIDRLIRRDDLEQAVELLDRCSEDTLNMLAYCVESAVNSEGRMSPEIRTRYHQFGSVLFKRLADSALDEFFHDRHQDRLQRLKTVESFRRQFDTATTTHELTRPATRAAAVEAALITLRHHLETASSATAVSETLAVKCHILTSDGDALLSLCDRCNNYNAIVGAAHHLLEREASARSLCLAAVLLLRHLGEYNMQLFNDSLCDGDGSVACESVDNQVFCEGVRLCHQLVQRALVTASTEEVAKVARVTEWVDVTFDVLGYGPREIRRKLFGDVFEAGKGVPGSLTFATVRKAFNAYCSFAKSFNNPDDDFLLHFTTEAITEEVLSRTLRELPSAVEHLCREGQSFTSFRIASTLRNLVLFYGDVTVSAGFHHLVQSRCAPLLLYSVLACVTVDGRLLLHLLSTCDRDDAIKHVLRGMRMYKRQPRKFAAIIQVALRFWREHQLTVGWNEMVTSLKNLKWWRRFDKKLTQYDAFFKATPEERLLLLIQADCLDGGTLIEYVEDCGLNPKTSYTVYLRHLLLNWRPEYVVEVDVDGRRRLVMRSTEDSLLTRCQAVIPLLDREYLVTLVDSLRTTVNRYHYEVLIVMETISGELDPDRDRHREMDMLLFLKNYRRTSAPSEREKEIWYSHVPDSLSLDPLSEFRLPFSEFLFTRRMWSIIRPEVNLRTYRQWFDVVDIAAPYVSVNEICSYVVNGIVADELLGPRDEEEWVLYPRHERLFEEIEECVSHITDLEMTTSVVYHLLTHTPNGADQVKVATLCYKYAAQYKTSQPESADVEKAYVKVMKKYFNCHATHILYTYRLAEKRYLNLVTDPKELILALYLDERILRKSEWVQLDFPDINKAADLLATLFGLDMKKLKRTMLETWLMDCPESTFDFYTSTVFTTHNSSPTLHTDNLRRAAYLCSSELDLNEWQSYLAEVALNSDESKEERSTGYKSRALRVFAMISDAATIEAFTKLNREEFMNFIDKMSLVSSLGYLGINLDTNALDKYSKKKLLNSLVQNGGTVLAIKTIADICMCYNIYECRYWKFVLKAAVKFAMFVELKTYLGFLKEEKFFNEHFYVNAWQRLVEHSFESLSSLKDDQLREVLVKNVLMIQSCPDRCSLKVEKLFRKCMDVGKVEFAAVLLQHVSEDVRNVLVKEIVELKTDLSERLSDLAQRGVWNLRYVQDILKRAS